MAALQWLSNANARQRGSEGPAASASPVAPAALPARPPRPRGGRAPPTPPGAVGSLDGPRQSQPRTLAQIEAVYPTTSSAGVADCETPAAACDASLTSASPALGLSSAGGSSSSTRAPSPATTATGGSAPASARRSPR